MHPFKRPGTSWERRTKRDNQLNKASPVYGIKEDQRIVTEYLSARVRSAFPESYPEVIQSVGELTKTPEFVVSFTYTPRVDVPRFNALKKSLQKVFTGPGAVRATYVHPEDADVGLHIKGSPARLVGDIERNDKEHLPMLTSSNRREK